MAAMTDQLPVAATAPVTIEPGFGTAKVVVAGQDVSNLVSRVSFDQQAGKLPEVFLELDPRARPDAIQCDAVVNVVREVKQDPAEATLLFLENVDPTELDRCILEAMELGGPNTYGEACLAVFKAWARGD